MKLIDDELGGTTPLEVILQFPNIEQKDSTEDDDYNDWENNEDNNDEKYLFTPDKIEKLESVHNYLDSLQHIGKVLYFY